MLAFVVDYKFGRAGMLGVCDEFVDNIPTPSLVDPGCAWDCT